MFQVILKKFRFCALSCFRILVYSGKIAKKEFVRSYIWVI